MLNKLTRLKVSNVYAHRNFFDRNQITAKRKQLETQSLKATF